MARPTSPRPTDVETQILKVFWEKGKGSIRDVHDELSKTKRTAYSSVATIARIMVHKGWLKLIDERRPQQFVAAISEPELAGTLINDLRDRVFGGTLAGLVRHALQGKKSSAKDIAELRKMLDEIE